MKESKREDLGNLSSGQQSQHMFFLFEASLNRTEKPLSDGFRRHWWAYWQSKAATTLL